MDNKNRFSLGAHAFSRDQSKRPPSLIMKISARLGNILLLSLAFPLWPATAQSEALSPNSHEIVGRKVWINECDGKVAGLTSWNAGEAFPSLGIGHFIWYPAGQQGPYEESLSLLIAYLKGRGIELPNWLSPLGPCPWPSRQALWPISTAHG